MIIKETVKANSAKEGVKKLEELIAQKHQINLNKHINARVFDYPIEYYSNGLVSMQVTDRIYYINILTQLVDYEYNGVYAHITLVI